MTDQDILIRILLALVFGGAIGLERRLRGHEAGPHTNALVCAGACLFIIVATIIGDDQGGRVVTPVATGIGFLAGGVILRDGLKVRGLNTAGTIWCVAALGCVLGLGRILLGLEAAVLFLIANTIFHMIEHRVPTLEDAEDMEDVTKTGPKP